MIVPENNLLLCKHGERFLYYLITKKKDIQKLQSNIKTQLLALNQRKFSLYVGYIAGI